MKIPSEREEGLPRRIQNRFRHIEDEVGAIIAKASRNLTTQIPRRIAFDIRCATKTGDVLTEYERAQSVSFVTRYEHLPDHLNVRLLEADGKWYIGNLWVLRHVLNDFRPIIQNQSDAVFYVNVHNVWYRMLRQTEPTKGTVLRVIDENDQDITPHYSKRLSENKRAVRVVLNECEFGYLYNGILQHSDSNLSERFFSEYISGELNYLLWKHVQVLGFIKSLLRPYHTMMRVLTFPTLGPL